MPSEYGVHGGMMEILLAAGGVLLIAIAAYRIFWPRQQQQSIGLTITGMIGERTSHNGPVTIRRILGPHGNGEPVLTNRHPDDDKNVPWETHRNGESANAFYEFQRRERTEDDPGDAYYDPRPARWWKFKKTSQNSKGSDTDRIYTRR